LELADANHHRKHIGRKTVPAIAGGGGRQSVIAVVFGLDVTTSRLGSFFSMSASMLAVVLLSWLWAATPSVSRSLSP
jgi:hypothetical protein